MKRLSMVIFMYLVAKIGASEDISDILSKDIEELINIKVETVSAASKSEENVRDAPGTVVIVTEYQIKTFGCRTLADVLNLVRGFYITYDYNYHYTGLRGFYKPGDYNSRILLLIDGHQINDNIYDQAFIGTDFLLDVDLIDRVEVILGPLSSLYGGNALFGVINIITKDSYAQELSMLHGSNDTYKLRLTLSYNPDLETRLMVSTSYYSSLGADLYIKELEARGYGDGRNYIGDYDKYASFFAKSILEDLKIFGGYIDRTKGIPIGTWGIVYNDRRNRSIDQRGFIEIKYDKKFEDNFGFMGRLFFDSYQYEGYYVYFDDLMRESARGYLLGSEVRGEVKKSNYSISLGLEFKDNFMQNLINHSYVYDYLLDLKHSSFSSGLYLIYSGELINKLRLNISTRYDYYEYYNNALSGKLALIYSLIDNSVLKFVVGNSFRPPNMYEMYYNDNNLTQKAPAHLSPEKIYQYEIMYSYYLSDSLSLNLSSYFSILDNFIGFEIDTIDKLIVSRNMARAKIMGFESSFEYQSVSGRIFEINYHYTYSMDDFKNSFPSHILKIRGAYPVIRSRFIPALSCNFISEAKTLRGDSLDSVLLCSAHLTYKDLFHFIDLSMHVYNLFNQMYYVPASVEHDMTAIQQEGITYMLKINGRF